MTSTAARLEAAGAGAVVLPSLFEEQLTHEQVNLNRSLEQGSEAFAEALDYFQGVDSLVDAADRYVNSIRAVKAATTVPVIASLNARTIPGWVRYAAMMADAGADAIELNMYHVAADRHRSGAEMNGRTRRRSAPSARRPRTPLISPRGRSRTGGRRRRRGPGMM